MFRELAYSTRPQGVSHHPYHRNRRNQPAKSSPQLILLNLQGSKGWDNDVGGGKLAYPSLFEPNSRGSQGTKVFIVQLSTYPSAGVLRGRPVPFAGCGVSPRTLLLSVSSYTQAGVQRAQPFARVWAVQVMRGFALCEGVQRAQPFAGVWGVPTNSPPLPPEAARNKSK
jgi:hypothetical protein